MLGVCAMNMTTPLYEVRNASKHYGSVITKSSILIIGSAKIGSYHMFTEPVLYMGSVAVILAELIPSVTFPVIWSPLKDKLKVYCVFSRK